MTVLYEDNIMVVVQKEPGEDCEKITSAMLYGEEKIFSLFCVHRLDKVTGGVMVYAKDAEAARLISTSLADKNHKKTYLAVCSSVPDKSGEMEDYLYHDKTKNKSFPVKSERKGARYARLSYNLIETSDYEGNPISLVSIFLDTGRTHQIRVQFSSRKMPLLGDGKYGSRVKSSGVALWAHELSFIHPVTGELLSFTSFPPSVFPWNAFTWQVS